ncbi:membrane protein insertase YidC [Methylomicrobium sp. Wu6]|uniref:membrane protein insertase YidC n=1 Tax=Methylomicrobium sp. Wu6 TaxID=3107928 RepID=UPI002DD66915|nr:membrane protein insertase YidC [Methylomicrobium sp. Wu6]MEC4749458.1 membrane protein insertase YidC [Methylomicrobium sp. Wu6]
MDNIRFLLIFSFGLLVFMLYQQWQIDYGPKPPVPAAIESAATNIKEDLPTASGMPEQAAASTPVQANVAASASASASKTVKIKTDVLALEIDLAGGTIQNLDLLAYPVQQSNTVVDAVRRMAGFEPETIDRNPVRIFNAEQDKIFIAQSGLISSEGSVSAPNHYTVFASSQDSYTLQDGQDSLTVPLTWTDNSGLTVTKAFTVTRGSYEIKLAQKIDNASAKPWSGRQYSQLLRTPEKQSSGSALGGMRAYNGGVIYTEKDKYKKIDFDDMREEVLDTNTKGGWAAFIQHYFASAWIPPADQDNHFYTKWLQQDDRYVIGSYSPTVTVPANGSVNLTASLFAGPKIQPLMEKVAKGLELTVDYSVLTFIGKPIYALLNHIHNFTRNWGLAIIGVTFCIKLLMFPLTQASFRSMAKMRKVQPRLKELQERFADDRMRLNQEMMALYKKEQVNPLGGCLPMLLQIPVFMCLYWVLGETVEFRQAPFALWLQDLSVQDPFYILPLIMGVTMKIQQGLNPTPVDPVQAKVIKMFPIIFTIFFLFFPAGLVLYWVVNNTLSICQQMYISKQIEKAGLAS